MYGKNRSKSMNWAAVRERSQKPFGWSFILLDAYTEFVVISLNKYCGKAFSFSSEYWLSRCKENKIFLKSKENFWSPFARKLGVPCPLVRHKRSLLQTLLCDALWMVGGRAAAWAAVAKAVPWEVPRDREVPRTGGASRGSLRSWWQELWVNLSSSTPVIVGP